jgi:hypothetical protein
MKLIIGLTNGNKYMVEFDIFQESSGVLIFKTIEDAKNKQQGLIIQADQVIYTKNPDSYVKFYELEG